MSGAKIAFSTTTKVVALKPQNLAHTAISSPDLYPTPVRFRSRTRLRASYVLPGKISRQSTVLSLQLFRSRTLKPFPVQSLLPFLFVAFASAQSLQPVQPLPPDSAATLPSSTISWKSSLAARLSGADAVPPAGGYIPRLFHALAVSARIGSGGIGGELATPLARRLVLRVGGQVFGYTTTFTQDGIQARGQLTLQNVYSAVNYFPFHHGFYVSPGITIHNDNHVGGTLAVPPGGKFSLGDQDYTSDPTDPVNGIIHIKFGSLVAPRLTLGWGNMFPRSGRHFSFPVEIGLEYSTKPAVTISLSGSACDNQGCGSIDTPENQANLQREIKTLNDDLAPLRFFPIVAAGVSYRFGH